MKKITSLFIIFAFVVGVISMSPALAKAEQERIPSPDQMKNFHEIIKRGNDLFGVRIASSTQAMKTEENKAMTNVGNTIKNSAGVILKKISSPDQIKNFRNIVKQGTALFGVEMKDDNSTNQTTKTNISKEDNADTISEDTLEKIATPAQISMYEKIRKIGTALWGVKKSDSVRAEDKTKLQERVVVSGEMVSCVTVAIDAKDQDLIARANTASEGLVAAISARSTCQQSAVASVDNQKDALDACVKAFQGSTKQVREQNQEQQKSIWSTFKASLKVCHGNSDSAGEGEIMIEDGSGDVLDIISE